MKAETEEKQRKTYARADRILRRWSVCLELSPESL